MNMVKFSALALLFVAFSARADHDEVVPAGEAAAIQAVMKLIEAQLRTAHGEGKLVQRDAHAKAHGCVKADFEVLPKLPANAAHGLFAKPRTYKAWVRYSNGSGPSQSDHDGDGRGMAIKVMGVPGRPTQDFLMINHPVFFVRNAEDYVEFTQAMMKGKPQEFFFPGKNPLKWRRHEFAIAGLIKLKRVTNLLNTTYFSMAPVAMGPGEMKYEARPCLHQRAEADSREGESFLRDNLASDLSAGDACFDLFAQLRNKPADQPIEDPTIEWKKAETVQVARITIPTQAFQSEEQQKFCENLSLTPWHALPEHRPLGGINRVRKVVYEEVSRLRHELNGEERTEPTP